MQNKTIIYLGIILSGMVFHTAGVAQEQKPAIYEEVMDGTSSPPSPPLGDGDGRHAIGR